VSWTIFHATKITILSTLSVMDIRKIETGESGEKITGETCGVKN
jgi:hypothetical protein